MRSGIGLLVFVLVLNLPGSCAFGSGSDEIATQGGGPEWWLVALFAIYGGALWFLARRRFLVQTDGELKPAFRELRQFSAFLLAGTIAAQLWCHGNPASYHATMHTVLFWIPQLNVDASLHFLVNDVFMVFFFGLAAKELAEATTKRDGVLRGWNGLLPMMACAGGIVGPALVFLAICTPQMAGAWAVPCATDIAFTWLGARMIWGERHPAVTFLLALAVADDFFGMCIIALFYPQRAFSFWGVVVIAVAVAAAALCNLAARRMALFRRWQVYLLLGAVCWLGLLMAGLHTALALVFVVPFMPMSGRDRGIFSEGEEDVTDTVNQFDRAFRGLVDAGLFFFGLVNAGVPWWGRSAWERDSWAVFLGLGIGKTVGITLLTVVTFNVLRLSKRGIALPSRGNPNEQFRWRDLPVVGLLGGMGFTVALFVADAAGGHPALKLGALASFLFLALAVVLGLAIRPRRTGANTPTVDSGRPLAVPKNS